MDQEIELKPVAISEILDNQFFIRHYQRGYRWTKEQVEQLLEDIDFFTPRELKSDTSKKTFYCLQPVVLKTLSEETKREIIENAKQERRLDGDWYVGEIACGTPPNRTQTLADLDNLPSVKQANLAEVLSFIEREALYGLGCGLVDISLLASTLLTTGAQLWTLDKRLSALAQRFGVLYQPAH